LAHEWPLICLNLELLIRGFIKCGRGLAEALLPIGLLADEVMCVIKIRAYSCGGKIIGPGSKRNKRFKIN